MPCEKYLLNEYMYFVGFRVQLYSLNLFLSLSLRIVVAVSRLHGLAFQMNEMKRYTHTYCHFFSIRNCLFQFLSRKRIDCAHPFHTSMAVNN